jgi:hypothetical protein
VRVVLLPAPEGKSVMPIFIISFNRNQRLMYQVEAENKALAVNEATDMFSNLVDPNEVQYGEIELDTETDIEEIA